MNIKSFKNSAKLLVASALAFGGLAAAAPAQAVTPDPANQIYIAQISAGQRLDANLVLSATVTYTDINGNPPAAGNYVYTAYYSCGNLLRTTEGDMGSGTGNRQSVFFSPDGQLDYGENSVNRRVGPSIEIVSTIVQPGYDAYTLQRSYNGFSVSRPSCDQINGGTPPPTSSNLCQVSKWSEKVSTARSGKNAFVGGPAKVSATKSSNCKVKYTWTLNGKKVKSGKTIFLKRSMRGKKLSMKIDVSKSGFKSAKKTLSYGRVRSR